MKDEKEREAYLRFKHYLRVVAAHDCSHFILAKKPQILNKFRFIKPVPDFFGDKGKVVTAEIMPLARLPRGVSGDDAENMMDYYITNNGHILQWKNENKNNFGKTPFQSVFLAEFKIKRHVNSHDFPVTQVSYLKQLRNVSFCDIVKRDYLTEERLQKYAKGSINLLPVV